VHWLRSIGTGLGIVASVMTGIGSFYLAPIDSCSSNCPPQLWLFGVGLPVALLACVVGSANIVFLTLLCSVGVGFIAGTASSPDASSTGYFIGGGSLLLAAGGVAIWWFTRNLDTTDGSAALYATGRPAVATLLSLTDTGGSVNDNPVTLIRVRMEPVDGGPAFETARTFPVSRLNLPVPGQRFAAYYDPAEPDRFTVVVAGEKVPDDVGQLRDRVDAQTRAAAAPPVDPLDRLAELNEQRRAGTLSEAEFQRHKAELLR
jgi:hypothetical protein